MKSVIRHRSPMSNLFIFNDCPLKNRPGPVFHGSTGQE